jgi:hypothetical protein
MKLLGGFKYVFVITLGGSIWDIFFGMIPTDMFFVGTTSWC